ncbi:HD domain-containing protein, partial [Priestia megaterium]|uniref:HD domain-containing protein n=1 Tax=Priestia megaterium TaxID=1404 RepID=UPI0031019879
NQVKTLFYEIKDTLDIRIAQVFENYTLHNTQHSFRIMNYMGQLVQDINLLTDLEIAMLVYSAMLHDIGMAASKEEINNIINGDLVYQEINYESSLKKFNFNKEEAIQDIVRRVHAERSSNYIQEKLNNTLIIPGVSNISFAEEVALICESHTKEDINWLTKNLQNDGVKGPYRYNALFCAILLRLGDILDFDGLRTPQRLFDLINPEGISKAEWEQHFVIDNINKVKFDEKNNQKSIELYGKCKNPKIHRKILSYINWINHELFNANALVNNMDSKYILNLNPQVNNYILSEGYDFADLRFHIDFHKVTSLLMGERIYGEKRMGLRELIQNSIDACKVRKEIEDNNREFGDEEYVPNIKINIDRENDQVSITDDGTGMTREILKKYFLNLGSSYYSSDDFLLKGYKYRPIGNYGIGFLSCFMLSEKVIVKTKHYSSDVTYEIELLKGDEYVCIKEKKENKPKPIGTEVILNYKEFMSVWNNNIEELRSFIEQTFLTDKVEIKLIDKDNKKIHEINNKLKANNSLYKIDLSNYLEGIDGEIILRNSIASIINTELDGLNLEGDVYYFDGTKLIPEEKADLDIFKLIDKDKVGLIKIPIIEDYYELDQIIDVVDDVDEALEKYIDDYSPDYISILTPYHIYETASSEAIFKGKEIVKGLYFDDLEDLGQEIDSYTRVETYTQKVLHSPGINQYLIVSSPSSIFTGVFSGNSKLYIRDVFINNFKLNIGNPIKGLNIAQANINILSDSIIPNVSRNDINKEDQIKINNAIYQAVCMCLIEQLNNHPNMVHLLKNYLQAHYSEASFYLRERYKLKFNAF